MDITRRDLLIAYRKAKVDCVESRLPERKKFLDFENHFNSRMERLFLALRDDNYERVRSMCKFGYYLLPKKAVEHRRNEDARVVDYRNIKQPAQIVGYELRIMADVSVEFHILTTLWVLKVGEKFDRKVSAKSYAARIRRRVVSSPAGIGDVAELSLGSFRSYRDSYKEWFDSAFDAVKKGGKWLLYLDVESFYHNLDAEVLLADLFINRVGVDLTEAEHVFTRLIVDLLHEWAKCTPFGRGLPTGMVIADLIANVSMYDIDQVFETFALQIDGSYGRYCDDILLVGCNLSVSDFAELEDEFISMEKRLGSKANINFSDLSFAIKTSVGSGDEEIKLKFNSIKSKLYLYDKGASVESSMEEIDNSDRYNALKSTHNESKDIILSMTFRRILSRANVAFDVKEQGISPLRSEFANIVSDFEALGGALLPEEWEHERIIALNRIKDSYLDIGSYYELHDYFPRLLTAAGMPKIALSMSPSQEVGSQDILVNPEWRLVVDILRTIKRNLTFDVGAYVAIDGVQCPRRLRRKIQRRLLDSVAQSLLESLLIAQRDSSDGAEMFIEQILAFSKDSGGAFRSLPSWTDFAQHDLCRRSVVESDLPQDVYVKRSGVDGAEIYGCENKKMLELLHKQYAYRGKTLPWYILFPCHEVDYGRFCSLFDESNAGAEIADEIGKLYSLVYGIPFRCAITCERGKEVIDIHIDDNVLNQRRIRGIRQEENDVAIAVVHWKAKQDNESQLHRYDRLRRVVEGVLSLDMPPKYLIMPELCIRRKWFWEMAKKLRCHGISFVAGVEHIILDDEHAINRVLCSIVVTKGSKYVQPQGVVVAFDKLFPAEVERELLLRSGRDLRPDPLLDKGIVKIVHHNNEDTSLCFGLLICRDFTDMSFRSKMRGRIDLLIVPCWNMDIHTYSSLVEATASDLHAYVICVNDRRYGDTRIRVPAKESWARDVVRILGGEEDLVMIGSLHIGKLRREQKKMLLGLSSDKFKPLPTGYEDTGSRLEEYRDYDETDFDDSFDDSLL